MRYRQLSPTGDYVFGRGAAEFLVDSPAAVAQAIQTRLELSEGDWYIDLTEGTPYNTDVLGMGTTNLYDFAFQARIVGTPGVQSLDDYASYLDTVTRALSIAAVVTTIYGEAIITGAGSFPHTGRLDIDFVLDESALA